ncbi:MAG TPA: BlaI/MecI/CopY family transcriptional regulator [Caulobacteraceae bacterium]|nr:BlaI/MecI/CopY family transcriptional regulator [Caulobacteraceae bacterium]
MPAIHITEAESVILEALWRLGPLPPMRLIAEVQSVRPWGAATIKTLLGRLKHKKAVRSERADGVLRYRALIERAAYVEGEVTSLVDRLFAGDAAALIALLSAREEPAQA